MSEAVPRRYSDTMIRGTGVTAVNEQNALAYATECQAFKANHTSVKGEMESLKIQMKTQIGEITSMKVAVKYIADHMKRIDQALNFKLNEKDVNHKD